MSDIIKRVPTHPGELLKLDVLPAMEVSTRDLARILDLPVDTVDQILEGKRSVDDTTADKLGAFFENSPQFWKNMQYNHDRWHALQGAEPNTQQEPGTGRGRSPSA